MHRSGFKLNKGRMRQLKRAYDASHCTGCNRRVTPFDRVELVPGVSHDRLRCKRCSVRPPPIKQSVEL